MTEETILLDARRGDSAPPYRLRRIPPALSTIIFLLFSFLVLVPAGLCDESSADRELYLENCAPCHGKEGRGNGPGIAALPVKPTDHTDAAAMSAYNDEYLFKIIAEGGVAVGRSPFMPAWGEQLSEAQIAALVAYIRSQSAGPKK